ncbi:hypothetical protein ACLIYM_25205 [Streptomyces fenghuangensis]
MSVVALVHERCPECGIDVPITVEARSAASAGSVLAVVLEPDLTDVVAHGWSHDLE